MAASRGFGVEAPKNGALFSETGLCVTCSATGATSTGLSFAGLGARRLRGRLRLACQLIAEMVRRERKRSGASWHLPGVGITEGRVRLPHFPGSPFHILGQPYRPRSLRGKLSRAFQTPSQRATPPE